MLIIFQGFLNLVRGVLNIFAIFLCTWRVPKGFHYYIKVLYIIPVIIIKYCISVHKSFSSVVLDIVWMTGSKLYQLTDCHWSNIYASLFNCHMTSKVHQHPERHVKQKSRHVYSDWKEPDRDTFLVWACPSISPVYMFTVLTFSLTTLEKERTPERTNSEGTSGWDLQFY